MSFLPVTHGKPLDPSLLLPGMWPCPQPCPWPYPVWIFPDSWGWGTGVLCQPEGQIGRKPSGGLAEGRAMGLWGATWLGLPPTEATSQAEGEQGRPAVGESKPVESLPSPAR